MALAANRDPAHRRLTRRLHRALTKERDIKVVFFTGLAEALPAKELAQYTVLQKPADMDNVVQTVAQVIAA